MTSAGPRLPAVWTRHQRNVTCLSLAQWNFSEGSPDILVHNRRYIVPQSFLPMLIVGKRLHFL
jgi:hypothetical protein